MSILNTVKLIRQDIIRKSVMDTPVVIETNGNRSKAVLNAYSEAFERYMTKDPAPDKTDS